MSGRYWLATKFDEAWGPPGCLPRNLAWIKGQLERCGSTGRLHWQFIVGYNTTVRLSQVKREFGEGHYELTRSSAADAYVWKDETAVEGSRFEMGAKPIKRNSAVDWDWIKDRACAGDLCAIPSDVYIRYYHSLRKIAEDHLAPVPAEKEVHVFHGTTGAGKSKRAWDEAGLQAYPKDPRTKWWCGYRNQENIVIDEFRGDIDVAHLLRWFDRYPVSVETKGSARPLSAKRFWITSNLSPEQWYPMLDSVTMDALKRRLTTVVDFNQ